MGAAKGNRQLFRRLRVDALHRGDDPRQGPGDHQVGDDREREAKDQRARKPGQQQEPRARQEILAQDARVELHQERAHRPARDLALGQHTPVTVEADPETQVRAEQSIGQPA
jgi:hypothetical protein